MEFKKALNTILATASMVMAASTVGLANENYTVNPMTAQAVINSVQDSPENHVTIYMESGTYGPLIIGGPERERYIDLIGGNDVQVVSLSGLYAEPAAQLRVHGTIKDITFVSMHPEGIVNNTDKGAYAVHMDYGSQNTVFENCDFISYQAPAVGMGLTYDSNVEFRKCTFENASDQTFGTHGALGAIYAHTAVEDIDKNGAKLSLIDCDTSAPSWAYDEVVVQSLNGSKINYQRDETQVMNDVDKASSLTPILNTSSVRPMSLTSKLNTYKRSDSKEKTMAANLAVERKKPHDIAISY